MNYSEAQNVLQDFLQRISISRKDAVRGTAFRVQFADDLVTALQVAIRVLASGSGTEVCVEEDANHPVSSQESRRRRKSWGLRWTEAEITRLKAWSETDHPHDASSIRSFATKFAPERTELAVMMQMEKHGLISIELADAFCAQLGLENTVSGKRKKQLARDAKRDQLIGQNVYEPSAQHDQVEQPSLAPRQPIEVSFKAFEALDKRAQEVRGFLVQLGPIPQPNSIWIFGDGKSWGQMIEHTDAIKNHRDAIDRIAKIFCNWVYECKEVISDLISDDLAKQFELRMTSCPEDIFQLLKVIHRQSDTEISKSLYEFMEWGGEE